MEHTQFWQIVDELGWPDTPCDEAKRSFMKRYPLSVAKEFAGIFGRFKNELYTRAGFTEISDSVDDVQAHIIGLGREVYEQTIANPTHVRDRLDRGDYEESFAYCIPHESDYALLTEAGYESYVRMAQKTVADIDSADSDDIPPRIYRQYPGVRSVCELVANRQFRDAVALYRKTYGEGYTGTWPVEAFGYGIPNCVKDLERYLL